MVRFVWVFAATYLPRLAARRLARRDPAPPWQGIFVIAFTGIRGVVSLAAALSIPLMADGAPFPDRGLLLLVTFAVILVTLVGQGFTLPWVIRLLGIAEHGRREADADKRREDQRPAGQHRCGAGAAGCAGRRGGGARNRGGAAAAQ